MLQVNSLNRGSCEGCEAACGVVFRPVCSRDQDTVYPNQCQAACAGAGDTVECQVHCCNQSCKRTFTKISHTRREPNIVESTYQPFNILRIYQDTMLC